MAAKDFMLDALRQNQAEQRRQGASAEDIRIRETRRVGNANWRAFQALGCDTEPLLAATEDWRKALKGIEYPWLVWSMHDDWCHVQQKLVESVGWTPVVGYDPRHLPTKLTKNAVLVNFNARLNLPVMWMHFPIDFIFAMAPRMAFWHSDLICDMDTMQSLATRFQRLRDGEISIVNPTSKLGLRRFLSPKTSRYWELAGCFTREASQHMYDHGCSIWQAFMYHPNCPNQDEFEKRSQYYWDHGTGIYYWHRRYRRKVDLIPEAVLADGHFTRIHRQATYKTVSPNNEYRDAGLDLQANFSIEEAVQKMGLAPSILEWDPNAPRPSPAPSAP